MEDEETADENNKSGAIDFLKVFKGDITRGATHGWKHITKSKQWKNDILLIKDKVAFSDRERVFHFYEAVAQRMTEQGYSIERVNDFKQVATELSDNAFRHACKNEKDKVLLEVTISSTSIEVTNPKNRRIPQDAINALRSKPQLDETGRQKIGLEEVGRISDSFSFLSDRRRVKAVLFRESSDERCFYENGVSFFTFSHNFFDSFEALQACIDAHPSSAFVLECTVRVWSPSHISRVLHPLFKNEAITDVGFVCSEMIAHSIELHLRRFKGFMKETNKDSPSEKTKITFHRSREDAKKHMEALNRV